MLGDAVVRGARAIRWVLQRIVIIAILIGGYLAVTGVQVWLTSRHHDARRVQAIVVMGAAQYDGVPSPDLVARLQDASSLWHRQLATEIVVTGSKKPGDTFTEAQASATWLEHNGVPAGDIVQVGGTDSWANLSQAATALHQRGLLKVLIVTDGFHEDRSLAIATDLGLQAWPAPTTHSPITGWSTVPYFAKETVGVAVGRVVGYSRLHKLG
ncbi:MAG TPA: YdcF family protein [Acidimicrobiales bacterium]|nr:YdcF family protein [Acidimicrobiales bacterium]